MKASISRLKKIEVAVREKFSKNIEEMEHRKFLELMKTCPPWLPEVYTFYFRLINRANQCLGEKQALPEDIRRPVYPEAYSFLLESVEELFHGRETVSREEIKQTFINVIRGSPRLRVESRILLLDAGNATIVTDEDMQRIYQK
jgi:phage terminase small subunit